MTYYGLYMLVATAYLSKDIWYKEARAISKDEMEDEVLKKLKRRISYSALYSLYDDHQEATALLDHLYNATKTLKARIDSVMD